GGSAARLAFGRAPRQARLPCAVALTGVPGRLQPLPGAGDERLVAMVERDVRAGTRRHQPGLDGRVQVAGPQQRGDARRIACIVAVGRTWSFPFAGAAHHASAPLERRLALLEEGAGAFAHVLAGEDQAELGGLVLQPLPDRAFAAGQDAVED